MIYLEGGDMTAGISTVAITPKMVEEINRFFGERLLVEEMVGKTLYSGMPGEVGLDLYSEISTEHSMLYQIFFKPTGQITSFCISSDKDPECDGDENLIGETNPRKVVMLSAALFGFEEIPAITPDEKMVQEAMAFRSRMGLSLSK